MPTCLYLCCGRPHYHYDYSYACAYVVVKTGFIDAVQFVNRDLKMRGREGQDGNGSGRGKLSRVPLGRQKQNTLDVFS